MDPEDERWVRKLPLAIVNQASFSRDLPGHQEMVIYYPLSENKSPPGGSGF